MNPASITDYIGKFVPLDSNDPTDCYLLAEPVAMAVVAAIAAGRALIVRGEPGCGKTELARAVAVMTSRRLISTTIQPDTEARDLLWSIDFTQRLADAQQSKSTEKIADYMCAGPAWWALEPETAKNMKGQSGYTPDEVDHPRDGQPDSRDTILLIDEIDKASGVRVADGLLEVLGKNCFSVPPLGKIVGKSDKARNTLIIFTSNNTANLPAAFLRRCVVLDLELPQDIETLLCDIGRKRHPKIASDRVLLGAARQIIEDRNQSPIPPRAGLAEYLDLLRALEVIAAHNEVAQLDWLDKLACCFKKSPVSP